MGVLVNKSFSFWTVTGHEVKGDVATERRDGEEEPGRDGGRKFSPDDSGRV